jgi:hypothetical protein
MQAVERVCLNLVFFPPKVILKSEISHPYLIQVVIKQEMSQVRLDISHGGMLHEEHKQVFNIVFILMR